MVDRVGQQIGNYRITRLLGKGGFAEVYLGEHRHLGTEAAIKILQAQLANEDIEQFRAEARIIARLEHPNIVRVLDFGLDENTPYLVMSYAPNGTLRQRYSRKVPVPLAAIVSNIRQVADALQYAHDQRLIHRDVKPENMLIGRRNEILLSDFGIALVTQSSRLQATRDVVGTVAYMAPEQIQGKPRPASDQYALAVVVYEWLSGERPFRGSFTEIAAQHAVTPPPPLREKLPSLSPEVERVVLTALAKQPEQRFATIQAFANALGQASQSIEPYRSASPEHIYSPSIHGEYPGGPDQVTLAATPPTLAVTPQHYAPRTDHTGDRSGEVHTTKRKLPRRMILVGGLGLAALAGGGVTWLALALQKSANNQVATTPVITNATPNARLTNTTTVSTATPSSPSPTMNASPTQTPITISTPLYTYPGHSNTVYGITWSSLDGQRIASGGLDKTVQDWNRSSGSLYFNYSHSLEVNDVKASRNKGFIASASDDKTVQIHDALAGTLQQTYHGHASPVYTVQWSWDGTRIVSASKDMTAQIWNPVSATTIQTLQGHTDVVWAAAWSPDGNYVVTASADGTARVWDAHSGMQVQVYRRHTDAVRSISWSPNSTRIASASHDNTVQIWEALSGTHLLTYAEHSNQLRTVEWSHDGTRIVSGGEDRTARVWNPNNGVTSMIYQGHTNTVFDAQWSPDDTLIASGGTDKTVQIWQPG